MTIKLYESNVYLTKTSAQLEEEVSGGYVFDQTIFAPEGGGQYADLGEINGIEVSDVKLINGQVVHFLKKQLVNKSVEMRIDWDHRLDQMQQHCGEHILSGIIKDLYDGNNKGFHMGKEYVTIDIDCKITLDMLDEIETRANDIVTSNIEIEFEYSSTLDQLDQPIRKDATVMEDIRIVTIPGVDCVACCGTHPLRTGDVGLIKLYKVEKNKKLSRIYFKCGKRALLDARRKTRIIQTLNQKYSCDDQTLLDRMATEKEKYEQIKKAFIKLNRSLIDETIKKDLQEDQAYQLLIFDFLPSQDMNYVIKKVAEKMNTLLILFSKSECKIVISHDGSQKINSGQLLKDIKDYHGKGGGNQKTAQGVFDQLEDGLKYIEVIKGKL